MAENAFFSYYLLVVIILKLFKVFIHDNDIKRFETKNLH